MSYKTFRKMRKNKKIENEIQVKISQLKIDVPKDDMKRPSSIDTSKRMKILFLSSDTGGGHRASAEALARQFELLYPGSTYDLLDVITDHGYYPYKNIVKDYKHLSANPGQWDFLYKLTNTKPMEWIYEMHFKVLSEQAIRERIKSFSPDVVISVHPLMNNIPSLSCQKISEETSVHLPFFTVITDLGSAHQYWFSAAKGTGNRSRAEKIFIASDQIKSLARNRGRDSVSEEKILEFGLPIRYDFSVQAKNLGDRMSVEGKKYQALIRESLYLERNNKTVLVMGGGEGVGSLSNIVDSLYVEFTALNINATICVVCGRNEKLKSDLLNKDWDDVIGLKREENGKSIEGLPGFLKKICLLRPLLKGVCEEHNKMDEESVETIDHEVKVVPLGFITNMAEYMVAADVLVSKAGPGTIAEATSVSLPIMLTNFLPGQEEGNVEYVEKHECGLYISDREPEKIGEMVGEWLCDREKLSRLSEASKKAGNADAASQIVNAIGESTLRWKDVKDSVEDSNTD